MLIDEVKTQDARNVWRLRLLGFDGEAEKWGAFWECGYNEYIAAVRGQNGQQHTQPAKRNGG